MFVGDGGFGWCLGGVGGLVVAVRTMMGMIWNDGHDGLWLFGALVLGWRGGCLPYPALLSAPVALTLALSRCCWVFWGRGDSPSSPPVHPWVPAFGGWV